jgi:hypothetical protein
LLLPPLPLLLRLALLLPHFPRLAATSKKGLVLLALLALRCAMGLLPTLLLCLLLCLLLLCLLLSVLLLLLLPLLSPPLLLNQKDSTL